jgi:hypothetical protein
MPDRLTAFGSVSKFQKRKEREGERRRGACRTTTLIYCVLHSAECGFQGLAGSGLKFQNRKERWLPYYNRSEIQKVVWKKKVTG